MAEDIDRQSKFTIEKQGGSLIFRTSRFDTGTGSVLHSGIYNREFSSMLASMAAAGLTYMVLVRGGTDGWIPLVSLLAVAVVTFPVFRQYVFRGRQLRTVFDKASGTARIFLDGLFSRMACEFPLADIKQLVIGTRKSRIENADGVEFVKKISLQHHTAIPGFGEETAVYLLTLKLADGRDMVIFAVEDMETAISAHDIIKSFIEKTDKGN